MFVCDSDKNAHSCDVSDHSFNDTTVKPMYRLKAAETHIVKVYTYIF